MKDQEKAKEIANNDILYGEDSDNNSKTDECYIAAMEMAEWKDKQYKEEKEALQETINALDARLQKANEYGMYYFNKCNIQKQLIDEALKCLNSIKDRLQRQL